MISYGSSPRMRGARGSVGRVRPEIGIIPADAGSTALYCHMTNLC